MNDVDRLITDEYERYKAEVLRTVAAKLGAAGLKSSIEDLEAPYNEAWHAVYMKLSEGEEIDNRVGFLVTVTHRRALSEHRASRARLRADEVELDSVGVEFDLDSRIDAEIKVRHFVEGLRAGLSEREFEAATLCHLHGMTRPEAAKAIGVKPRRMEKIMDGASNRIAAVIERVQAGEHCESMDSQIRAYAVGMLDPGGDRYRQAQDHLDHCPACRRQVCVLRGLAAAVPPIPVVLALTAGSATTGGLAVHGATGAAARPEAASAAGSGGSGGGAAGSAGSAAEAGGKTGLIAAASAGVAVAAVAVVAVATGAIGGGGDSSDDPPAITSSAPVSGQASSATVAESKAKAKAKARARAKARAERRREQRNAEIAEAPPAVAEAPPAAVEPVPAPVEPVYVPPPAPVPDPEPAPGTKPPERPVVPPEPQKPTTDAGDEFGLR